MEHVAEYIFPPVEFAVMQRVLLPAARNETVNEKIVGMKKGARVSLVESWL